VSELLTVKDLSQSLRISARQVWKLLSGGRLPEPVRLARSVRWRAADIARFIELGCPSREEFEAAKAPDPPVPAGGRRSRVQAAEGRAVRCA